MASERDLENLISVISQMSQRIARLEAREINPVGTILMNTNPILPANHLACDGTTYNKTDYESLYAVLGTRFGGTTTTFKVPDLRGRVPIGSGNDWGVGEIGGAEEHTLTTNEIPDHAHLAPSGGGGFLNQFGGDLGTANVTTGGGGYVLGSATAGAGGGAAHNNMPPYLVVSFIIVAR